MGTPLTYLNFPVNPKSLWRLCPTPPPPFPCGQRFSRPVILAQEQALCLRISRNMYLFAANSPYKPPRARWKKPAHLFTTVGASPLPRARFFFTFQEVVVPRGKPFFSDSLPGSTFFFFSFCAATKIRLFFPRGGLWSLPFVHPVAPFRPFNQGNTSPFFLCTCPLWGSSSPNGSIWGCLDQ